MLAFEVEPRDPRPYPPGDYRATIFFFPKDLPNPASLHFRLTAPPHGAKRRPRGARPSGRAPRRDRRREPSGSRDQPYSDLMASAASTPPLVASPLEPYSR
jgi:hypothetical protein